MHFVYGYLSFILTSLIFQTKKVLFRMQQERSLFELNQSLLATQFRAGAHLIPDPRIYQQLGRPPPK